MKSVEKLIPESKEECESLDCKICGYYDFIQKHKSCKKTWIEDEWERINNKLKLKVN